ncbi:MAG: hypothetical protein V8Q82_09095 [Christensenellales bacterium]
MNGKAEALEFIARANDPYIGIPLRKLHAPRHPGGGDCARRAR